MKEQPDFRGFKEHQCRVWVMLLLFFLMKFSFNHIFSCCLTEKAPNVPQKSVSVIRWKKKSRSAKGLMILIRKPQPPDPF